VFVDDVASNICQALVMLSSFAIKLKNIRFKVRLPCP